MKENLTKQELFVEQNNKTNKTIPFEKGGIVGNKEPEFVYTPKSYKSFIELKDCKEIELADHEIVIIQKAFNELINRIK